MIRFIFDLDGTITSKETLPLIAKHFNVDEQIKRLTEETINGNIPFVESFIRRVHVLGGLPVSEINDLLSGVPLTEKVFRFIQENKEQCVVATGNLYNWVEKLTYKIGCKAYTSDGIVEENKVKKLTKILKKEDVVNKYKAMGDYVIFIGDGNNDVEAMKGADISIACGLIHYPTRSVLSVADYAVFDERALLRLLYQINNPPSDGKSIILNCAGIGSRLGLGKTKALINIGKKPLIYWQLEQLERVKDVRIVVGFQFHDVINKVLDKWTDIIFVFNHNYFNTKTGASYYLGARHGNRYSIEWDGDLLVHPKDIDICLNYDGEYVGCSGTITDDAVLVTVDEKVNAISFSRKFGDYEWSGPGCLMREHVKYNSNNVYNQIEEYLPLPAIIIEAQDIDTFDDYKNAIKFIKSWENE